MVTWPPAATSCLTFSNQGNLPGKPDRRTKIVPIARIDLFSRIRRIRSDKLQCGQIAASPGRHPTAEVFGNAKRGRTSSNQRSRQAVGFIRNPVILVTQTEIESEILLHLPVILKKERQFILMEI